MSNLKLNLKEHNFLIELLDLCKNDYIQFKIQNNIKSNINTHNLKLKLINQKKV